MDVEQLMKLIDKVSESDLTGFKYEENGIKLQLNKKENLVMGTTAAVQAVTPEAVKVTGASSKAATDLEEGVQKQTGTSEAAPVGNVVKAPLVGTPFCGRENGIRPLCFGKRRVRDAGDFGALPGGGVFFASALL